MVEEADEEAEMTEEAGEYRIPGKPQERDDTVELMLLRCSRVVVSNRISGSVLPPEMEMEKAEKEAVEGLKLKLTDFIRVVKVPIEYGYRVDAEISMPYVSTLHIRNLERDLVAAKTENNGLKYDYRTLSWEVDRLQGLLNYHQLPWWRKIFKRLPE